MEQDIIVEGFSKSIQQHGIIYKYLIGTFLFLIYDFITNYYYYFHCLGDGDSSVYARIVERVPYGRTVEKIECANHVTRNINDKLHKLAINTQFPLEKRKFLSEKCLGISRIERIVKGVRIAIKKIRMTQLP